MLYFIKFIVIINNYLCIYIYKYIIILMTLAASAMGAVSSGINKFICLNFSLLFNFAVNFIAYLFRYSYNIK